MMERARWKMEEEPDEGPSREQQEPPPAYVGSEKHSLVASTA